jgi:hypothetical protein
MNKTRLHAALRVLACGAMLCFAPLPAGADSPHWRSLLQDHSAPAWRGWHIAGGVLSKEGAVERQLRRASSMYDARSIDNDFKASGATRS